MAAFFWSLLGHRWWITALVFYAMSFVTAIDLSAWPWTIPLCLGGILFFTGLRLPWGEMTEAARDGQRWGLAGWFTLVRLFAIPLAAWGITLLIAPEWATGVLLCSLMPAGLSSIAFTDLLKGDRTLAILAVIASSLVAPLSIPLLLQFLGPDDLQVDAWALAGRTAYIVAMLVIPLSLAQVVRRLCPQGVARHASWWPRAAVASSIALGTMSILGTVPSWGHWSLHDLLVPTGLASLPVAATLLLGLASRRWLVRGQADALTCAGVYFNNGLAVAFATAFFPGNGLIILPGILMITAMVLAVMVVGRR